MIRGTRSPAAILLFAARLSCGLYRICRAKDEHGGQGAAVDDEHGHKMNAEEIDEGIEVPRLFLEFGVAPILMGEPAEGVRPIRGETHPRETSRIDRGGVL